MKRLFDPLIVGLAAIFCFAVFNCRADLEVSAAVQIHATTDFNEPLSPHGSWVEIAPYGRCWHPARIAVEWRPYCEGHWVWTDCGWYWMSDEPWAWACYHYGSWVYHPDHAWIWVPGIEWAPAWVEWRVGGGFIGWAPLPPRGIAVVRLPAPPFIFVETHRFREPLRPSTVVVNNTTILNKTTVINNIKEDTRTFAGAGPRKVMVNEGPGLDPIQKATGKTVSPVPIREVAQQTRVPPMVTRRTEDSRVRPVAPALTPTAPQKSPRPDEPAGLERPARDSLPSQGSSPSSGKGRGKGHGEK